MTEPPVSAAGMRLLRLLVGKPPQTVVELVESTGRTRTAVAAQLTDLMTAGLVNRSAADSPGPGRPRHLYSATAAAKLLFQAHLDYPLSVELLKALTETGGGELVDRVLQRVGQSLAVHLREKISGNDPVQRLHKLADLLQAQGVLVDVEQSGSTWTMRERTCPFAALVDQAPGICQLEQSIFSRVVGGELQLVDCTRHGGASCAYALDPNHPISHPAHPQSS